MKTLTTVIAASCAISLVACSSGDSEKKKKKSYITVPEFAFELPEPASSAAFLTPPPIMTNLQERTNDHITRLNDDLAKITTKFTAVGVFLNGGPEQNRDEELKVSEDSDYDYELVTCVDDQPHMITKWKTDGSRIYTIRDHNTKSDNPEDVKYMAEYVESGDTKTMTMQFYGEPRGKPNGITDTHLAEYTVAQELASGSFVVRNTEDWFTPTRDYTAAPNNYLVGTMDADGEGEFVSWNTRKTDTCTMEFSESDTTGKWCASRNISEGAYSLTEADTAWTERLEQYGLVESSNLGDITLDFTCPTE